MSHKRLALVIPTKDRSVELKRMLESLAAQTCLPDQVIIVDEAEESDALARELSQLSITTIAFPGGSAAAKRNRGLLSVNPRFDLIGFMDDDIVLAPNAIQEMLSFWEKAPETLGGAGFNIRNLTTPETSQKWKLRPLVWIYDSLVGKSERKGSVLPSGFPTPIYPVTENTYVDWLETMALVFRGDVVKQFQFDEFFEGYSYLEFLDYTFAISRKYRLCVVGDAWITHYSSPIKRSYLLGKKQVINRLFFVRKHPELSQFRCCLTLVTQMFFNVVVGVLLRDSGHIQRACGNCVGFALIASGRMQPVSGGIK